MPVRLIRKFDAFLGKSLQRRLIAVSALFLILASVAFMAILLLLHTRMLLGENERASLALNQSLQIALENAMLNRDLAGLSQIVDRLGAQPGIDGVMILSPEGEVRFSDRHDRIGQHLDDSDIVAALTAKTAIAAYRRGPDWADVLRSINPVRNRAACSACHGDPARHPVNGLLVVDFRAAPVVAQALRGTVILIGMGAVVMALLGLALWKATRRLVLDRLEPLAEAVRAVGQGDISTRVDPGGEDEIAALAQGFNTMAARLEAADEALRLARDALDAILAAAPDGIRVIDANFRVRHANLAHLEQMELPRSAVIGQSCYRLTHGRDRPCPATLQTCPVVRILQEGAQKLRYIDRHRRADGRFINVEVTAAPIRLPVDHEVVDCVVEVIRDLGREVELSHQQRLGEIALLANGVAHEINTPLSSILLALGTIREALPKTGEAREFADLIEREIQTCMDVTESLMRLSLPATGSADAVDLVEVAHDILRLVRPNLEQAGIIARIEAPERLVIEAADSDMRILVLNLVVNAIHAMANGGQLTISVSRITGGARLTVADTGVGIAAQDLEAIFLPFWTRRADGTPGRGLGLAICQQVVERLGGRIEVHSEPGKGSAFVVYLPERKVAGSAGNENGE